MDFLRVAGAGGCWICETALAVDAAKASEQAIGQQPWAKSVPFLSSSRSSHSFSRATQLFVFRHRDDLERHATPARGGDNEMVARTVRQAFVSGHNVVLAAELALRPLRLRRTFA